MFKHFTELLFRKHENKSHKSKKAKTEYSKGEERVMVNDLSLMAETPEETRELVPSGIIKTEANFANLPFFALSNKDAGKRIETEYRVIVERDGQKLEALWQVTANAKYGYPTPFDRKVHKAIEYLITARGFPVENPIPFTIYRILQLLEFSKNGGANYRKVKQSLERIKTTSVKSEGTFYDKTKKQYITDIFNLYDRVIFKGRELPNGETAESNYIFLSSWYLSSLNAYYVRPIDFEYLKSLKSDVAGRLYELLGLRFYGVVLNNRSYWRVTYNELCDLLPIAAQRYYSDARRYLGPAHRELKQTGFLTDFRWEKESRDTWCIRYYPGKRAKRELTRTQRELGVPEQLDLALKERQNGQKVSGVGEREKKASAGKIEAKNGVSKEEQDLKALLVERGVGKKAVARLVEKYARRAAAKVEIFDWIQRHQPDKIVDNPAGYLRQMIEEDWPAPKDFRTKAEEEEAKRRSGERRQEIIRQSKAAEFREWQAMTPEEKVRGEVWWWRRKRKDETGLYPTEEEVRAKEKELLANLPTDEEYRFLLTEADV